MTCVGLHQRAVPFIANVTNAATNDSANLLKKDSALCKSKTSASNLKPKFSMCCIIIAKLHEMLCDCACAMYEWGAKIDTFVEHGSHG